MSESCSLCGLEESFYSLKPINNTEINLEMKLKEAFKVEFDLTKMSQICNKCEINLEVSWQFYQQVVEALKAMKSKGIKKEPEENSNEIVIKVEYKPVYAELFDDFNNESFSDGQDGETMTEDVLKPISKRRQQKAGKLTNKQNFKLPKVKATRVSKTKAVIALEPSKLPEPLKATDKPPTIYLPYKKKGEPGYRSSDARGIRKKKDKLRYSMFDIFDEEITINNYVAEPEVLGNLVENSRLWSDYTWSCKECETNFENVLDLNQHLHNWHKKKYRAACIECDKETPNYSSFLNHVINVHHPNLKFCCVVCSEHHTRLIDLYKHFREEHQQHNAFFCLYCGLHFSSGSSLRSHAFLRHNRIDRIQAIQPNFHCDHCGFQAPLKTQMFAHVQKHRERSIHCDQCTKIFRFDSELKLHTREIHPKDNDRSVCFECGKQFVTLRRLKKHHRLVHEKIKKHSCDICGKAFAGKTALTSHKYTHDEKALGHFQCQICEKRYRHISGYKYHMRTHTGKININLT